ncbi:hypothetical protein B0H16DRAFT_1246688, partial [Mycena metata]
RLFREDDGVEGCGLYHKRPEQMFHVLGNVLRLIFSIILSPLYLITPRAVVGATTTSNRAGSWSSRRHRIP